MDKKNLSLTILLVAIITTAFFTGCSQKGFEAQNTAATQDPSQGASGTDDTGSGDTPAPVASIETLDLKSRVEDSGSALGFNGALTFDFDKTRGEFIIMVPMPSSMIFSPSGSFNNYPDIKFGPIFDATGKRKIAIRVPVRYVLKGVSSVNPGKLPSGEDLPAMPAGQNELPSLGLKFPLNNDIEMHLYIGVNALGFYLTLPNEASIPMMPFNLTMPLKNKDKTKTSGYLTYVTAKGGHPPGIFVSTLIPSNIARMLEDHFGL